ncbi:unnamed protein product [Closterium sp. Yama58-4]|nr:unnamed protein product [Closterium sp. Yama58-4]
MKASRNISSSEDDPHEFRLLSLPDELLSLILTRLDRTHDRCSVALSCSRLRRLSRRTPHSLHLKFVSPSQNPNRNGWSNNLDSFSRVFTHIRELTVEVRSNPAGTELLAGVGAACPKLERLSVVGICTSFFLNDAAALAKLAKQCPLLTSLTFDSPWDLCMVDRDNNNHTSVPPFDAFPALHSLSLRLPVPPLDALPRCSSLTSLTLWKPHPSTLSFLASSSSAVRPTLNTLNLELAQLVSCLAPSASFPSLSSLGFRSCTIDPCELHALSRSLHTLTHLAILNCPLLSSHSLATLAQTNPALSSLALAPPHITSSAHKASGLCCTPLSRTCTLSHSLGCPPSALACLLAAVGCSL